MRKNKPKFQKERPPDQHAVGTDWRLFIALPIPEDVQLRIGRLSSALGEKDWPVRWVAADSAHLTLHFIGETPPERAELLRMGLESVVARHGPFMLGTGDLGVFPDYRRPRVLWLGLTGETDRLEALQRDIGRELLRLGFEIDTRRFHPHVTLGRVRDDPPPTLGGDVQRAFEEPAIVGLVVDQTDEFKVDELILVRSFLERGGSRHVPIMRYPLRGRAPST